MHSNTEVPLPQLRFALLMVLSAVLLTALPATAPAAPYPAASDPIVEVPLRYVDGRLLVEVEIDGAGTSWFILDTAAGRSVISGRLRSHLAPDAPAIRRDTVQGATGPTVMEFVRLPPARVGGTAHEGLWAVVADISDFRTQEGLAVEGILGVDVLARYDVGLDVPAGMLRLHPRDGSAASSLAGPGAGVPFHSSVQDGFVQFTATLHGRPVQALLDTGARTGTLNWNAAALAGIAPGSEGVREDARGAGGMSGKRVPGHRYVFGDLCLGERCLPPTEMRIMDLPVFRVTETADGPAMLVGADLLESCPVLLSYSTDTLHVCTER